MATTYQDIGSEIDDNRKDTTSGSIDTPTKIRAINGALRWLLRNFKLPASIRSADINFFSDTPEYSLASTAPDFMDSADLRIKEEKDHKKYFTYYNPEELAWKYGRGLVSRDAFTVETRDGVHYLRILHQSKYSDVMLHDCESLTSSGTWSANTTTSDATNLTVDTIEFHQGSASLNFDVDVSQHSNDYAELTLIGMTALDLSDYENLGAARLRLWIPSGFTVTSVLMRWGNGNTASSWTDYWEKSVTVDHAGGAFSAGNKNLLSFDWASATKTGAPDPAAVTDLLVRVVYAASAADATDFRLDDIRMARKELLSFRYFSSYVSKTSAGVWQEEGTATSDVAFFSGVHDELIDVVSQEATRRIARQMEDDDLYKEVVLELKESVRSISKSYPSRHRKRLTGTFKVKGMNFNRRARLSSD